MLPMPNLHVDKHVRRELDCTPTLARINTDYDPGSVVSTAQSNNNSSDKVASGDNHYVLCLIDNFGMQDCTCGMLIMKFTMIGASCRSAVRGELRYARPITHIRVLLYVGL